MGRDSIWSKGELDTVVGILRRAAEQFGDQPYLVFGDGGHSYSDIWEGSLRVAEGLRRLGVGRGDTVVALLDSTVDSVLVWYGVNMLGAIWVPTNTAYKGEFLRHQLTDADAKVVIAESDYADRVLTIADQLPRLTHLVDRGPGAAAAEASFEVVPFAALLAAPMIEEIVEVDPRELSMLIYTSGTTGPSKGCMLSHNYVCNVARGATRYRQPGDVLWTPLPLFHLNASATTVLATAIQGLRAHIYPRFSLSNFWPQMVETGATHITLLGAMIPLIAYMDDTPEMKKCKGQLKYAGGAPYPPDVLRIWKERFGAERVGSTVFGLTETTFLTNAPDDGTEPPHGCAGRVNDDFDVRIFDDEDNELPPGEPGEIVARPKRPHVMFEGYWRRPEATRAVMRNMWFHTGDIGRFDEDGWLWFVDRKKDYLRRRGENISSQEVENTFLTHPDVIEAAVHAVPSDLTEDDLKVTAVLREGATVTEEELCRWSTEHLPYFAVPRYVEFRDGLPRNPTGKVLKYQLRDEGATDRTWDRESSDIALVKR